jgi:DNA-binding PucR family transcriptional regulator
VATGSARAGILGLATSYREAKRALALGALADAAGTVYTYEELQLFDLFKEGEAIDHFVSEVLSPIFKERGTKRLELLKTLEVLFRTGQNRKQAAHELRIHVNTLAYRIHRLEELLGESLTLGERSGDTTFRLQLALRLLPMTRLAELD